MRRPAALLLAALLAACGSGSPPPGPDALADLPELPFQRVASIGGTQATGPSALGSVADATLIPGTDLLAVVDGTTQQISYFTRTGQYVRTIGGRGGGPEESRALRRIMGTSNGGLCAWDVQLARMTRRDSTGAVPHTAHADLQVMEDPLAPRLVGFLDDCSFVLRDGRSEMAMGNVPQGPRQDTARFLLFTPEGALADTVATILGARKWFTNRGGVWGENDLIFGDELMCFVSGPALWVGVDDSLRWIRYDLRSGALDTVRLPVRVRRPSADEIARERKRRLDSAVAANVHQRGRVFMNGKDLADVFTKWITDAMPSIPVNGAVPAYDRAVPGEDGSVWIRRFPMPSDSTARWLLLTDAPRLEGRVSLARSDRVLAGDRDWLLVLTKDEMDAPVVQVLRRQGATRR